MRSIVVVLGLALVMAAPAAAEAQWKVVGHSHTAAPAVNVDFGLRKALAVIALSQAGIPMKQPKHEHVFVTPALPLTVAPVDCAMVKKHTHELSTPTPIVTPQTHAKHQLKVIAVPGCPAR
jgi:hypothetical protein